MCSVYLLVYTWKRLDVCLSMSCLVFAEKHEKLCKTLNFVFVFDFDLGSYWHQSYFALWLFYHQFESQQLVFLDQNSTINKPWVPRTCTVLVRYSVIGWSMVQAPDDLCYQIVVKHLVEWNSHYLIDIRYSVVTLFSTNIYSINVYKMTGRFIYFKIETTR